MLTCIYAVLCPFDDEGCRRLFVLTPHLRLCDPSAAMTTSSKLQGNILRARGVGGGDRYSLRLHEGVP